MAKSKKIQVNTEDLKDSVKDVKLEHLIPNVIDDYIVTVFEGHQTIVLPLNITGTQFRSWYKGKGGVFAKDVLNFTFKQPHGKYILIKSKGLNCVARVITEEEELQFRTMKLVDGQIKDRPYMILKKLEEGEKLSSTQRYINEKDVEHEENPFIPASRESSQDDDVDHHVGSISLFTE
jgi:hypothetical protein